MRIIAGTVMEISSGRLDENCAEQIFKTGKREFAGKTASPQGLFLNKVFY